MFVKPTYFIKLILYESKISKNIFLTLKCAMHVKYCVSLNKYI